jgi:CBS domain-containing protein
MKTIAFILKSKEKKIWSITPTTSVYDALSLMAEKDIGAVPVLEKQHLVGIFSERDYARKVILKGKSSHDLQVGEIMSTRLVVITPTHTTEDGLALMTAKHVRHLPVIKEHKLVGFISIGDLVKSIIDEQQIVIEKLDQYIREKIGWY